MFETNIDNNSSLISLARAAQLTGYHQDYLGQLCRIGKLPATKKGRNWFTSEDALNRLSSIVEEVKAEEPTVEFETFEFPQPTLAQTVTVSEVEGMPIFIRTLTAPIRSTNSVQNILNSMRIESLQQEVLELRQMLARLMMEVASHTNILQGRSVRSDQLRHSYISNFDFSAPYSRLNIMRQDEEEKAPALAPELSAPLVAQPRYSAVVWIPATAVVLAIALMLSTIISGQFFDSPESDQVSSIYYHSQLQPTVAGDTLPTDQAGELRTDMLQ